MAALEMLVAYPIPKPQYGVDTLGWHWDDNRCFKVGSTYQYLVDGGTRHRNSKWKLIWSLKSVVFAKMGKTISIMFLDIASRHKDWVVNVSHINKERNGVADSLVATGMDHGMNGSVFVVPPESLVVPVEEERHHWVVTLPTKSLASNHIGGLVEIDDSGR
ncbi:hypothetical protein V6N12_069439 [Hibiscus sabdariffa]|uniref:RNase H type-1 domain-containing protein n=1 Tax=Hibiscus sabdariffa TaxID=183260 RepID=A0ABR2FDV9_9ROSI